jgi:hypothetical protein
MEAPVQLSNGLQQEPHQMHVIFRTPQIALLVIGSIIGGVSVTTAMNNSAHLDAARSSYSKAVSAARETRAAGLRQLDAATDIGLSASKLDVSSYGQTGDDSTRTALAAAIVNANHVIDTARGQLRALPAQADVRMLDNGTAKSLKSAAKHVSKIKPSALGKVSAAVDGVLAAEDSVTKAESDWTEHLREVAAAQAAAAAAAQAAAAQAAAAQATAARAAASRHPVVRSVRASAPRAAAAPAGGGTVLNVWTSGFQAQLDACHGAVNLSGAYGVPTIGEKWGCGGARFPGAGSIITLTGVISGTFRVGGVVAVLNAYVDSPRNIPRGYQLLFQTCRGNDAHTETFTALTRVG